MGGVVGLVLGRHVGVSLGENFICARQDADVANLRASQRDGRSDRRIDKLLRNHCCGGAQASSIRQDHHARMGLQHVVSVGIVRDDLVQ